ncbi:mannose-1-phosphate guanylyltransferase [Candidatus Shapirobacteria bacterium CG03_land_8_20_14_0_80_40_19]|uniref:Mannose-1-phosphate guanylyltransferase n=3 Tax=Candidatus Shapironibacteriota TaxID=1752721 RepID=A0A2M7BBB7_9BACT|nr:MAG: mannose-1-phosphate guanylyltransferase [Candidatus Shapirobacteria bacterium CG11_big_fil_rev_8_21_14_0_20_40_12]PIV00360.1 MAG: mannose-1-phosphate guanylyltransferase [Candidatus Shapirobacteria bacterium CG03_land_8_20_14_0_80_40_19]PJC76066.1 MAG: mannose-1-phosphate guanylyltransferase [Candidatus Shapirobacteria bacterium CG_4_8_14_3_um_filter_39_11]
MAETFKEHLYALIVCGGAGTRLWPRSRKSTPKQFLPKFYGEKTLFGQTLDRAKLLTEPQKIYFVVTSNDNARQIVQFYPEVLKKNIIVEPMGRNTAMAVGVGASYIRKVDPGAVVMNFWSDAVIKDNDLFYQSLILAAETAFNGNWLVTVGLKPTFPHTGLGYIETGEQFSAQKSVFKVSSFKEKPDLKTAEGFLAKGNYFWNTGIYVWSVSSIFEAFSKHSPNIFKSLENIFNSVGLAEEKSVLADAYDEAESLPIDTAVSEKADNLLLVPASFGWSDIGDWKVTYELKSKDVNGNVIEVFGEGGTHLGFETKNCLVEAQSRLVATVGVSDLIIVEMKDVVLVCNREKAQDVKNIVNTLKEQKKDQYL